MIDQEEKDGNNNIVSSWSWMVAISSGVMFLHSSGEMMRWVCDYKK
jgi:hypothetical protein